MLKSKAKSILLLCSIGIITLSCNLEYFGDAVLEDFEWNPSIALPIGEISYSVEDLFEDLTDSGIGIGTNADDIVTLTYEENLQAQSANAFVGIVDQNFNQKRASGLSINNPGVSSQIVYNDSFAFDWRTSLGELYDSVNFSSGDLQVQITSDLDAEVVYSLTLRSFSNKSTRTPLVISGTLTTANPTASFNNQLANYIADFSKDENGVVTTNSLVVQLDYQVNVSPSSSIQATDGLDITIGIIQPQFEEAFVFVGQRPLDISFELVNLDFFDAFGDGTIDFAEPLFKFTFENSFGFPLGISFNEMAAVTQTGQIINLTGDAVNSINVIGGPQVSALGTSVSTTFELNANNSNLPALVNSKPSKVIIDVNAFANPNEAPSQYNFLLNSSELRINGKLEMPMVVNINQLTGSQRVDLNIASTLEQANRLLLRIITENELPLGGDVELAFMDANDNELFVVSERAFFDAAPVGSNGRTTGAISRIADIELTSEQIRLIENAVGIDVRTRLSSTNAGSGQAVRFFSDYQLKVKLAAQADVVVSSNN